MHPLLGSVARVPYTTDNNCLSVILDFGQNACRLDRSRIVLSERETSQKQFTALKCRHSFYSALVFSSGKLIVVGLQDLRLVELCVANTVSSIADTLEHPVSVKSVSIVNTVSTFNRFAVNLTDVRDFFVRHCIAFTFNPDTFPGMFFKVRVPSRPLEKDETLGRYYTRVAAECEAKVPPVPPEGRFSMKTILVFKVGKCTVLGECGANDIDAISKLLFGFLFHFMDRGIKLSVPERDRLVRTYGVPPLEWYLHTHVFFYAHPYRKPTRRAVTDAALGMPSSADSPYCGSALRTIPTTAAILNELRRKAPRARDVGWADREARLVFESVSKYESAPAPAPKRRRKSRKDTFDIGFTLESGVFSAAAVRSAVMELVSELASMGCYSGIRVYDPLLVAAADGRWGEERVAIGLRRRPRFLSRPVEELETEDAEVGRYAAGARVCAADRTRKQYITGKTRCETLVHVHSRVQELISTGGAKVVAEALESDVYSVLRDAKNLPKSAGLKVALDDMLGANGSMDPTAGPGDRFFESVQQVPWAAPDLLAAETRGRDTASLPPEEELKVAVSKLKRVNEHEPMTAECAMMPIDFIESVVTVEDDRGVRAGVEINVGGLMGGVGTTSERERAPMANYRTCLQRRARALMGIRRVVYRPLPSRQ